MRVGIFLAVVGQKAGGPETYERRLVEAIARVDRETEYHVFCIAPEGAREIDCRGANMHVHVLWPRSRWLSVPAGLPLAMLRHRISLNHATFVPPPLSPVGYVLTMHDVTPFVHPEYYPPHTGRKLRTLVNIGLRKAKMIICISRHVLETTVEHFKIPRERLAVVHHGVDPRFRPLEADEMRPVLDRYDLRDGYILYAGKLEPRKNVLGLLESFHRFERETRSGLRLVLVGRRMWRSAEIDETIARLELSNRIVELGYVPEEHMPALYAGARLFVFPTLWEGFGIPVLEAMASGTPVVTSNVTSIPEVAGDAALLVDPTSVDAIAEAMYRVHSDDDLRQSLRERGRKRASSFTWERAARQTIDVYQRARAL